MNAWKFFFAVTFAAIFFDCMSDGATKAEIIPPENFSADTTTLPRQNLIVYSSPEKYSYENLLHDVEILRETYPSQIQVVKLCDTVDGRGVFDIVLGDFNGDKQILVFGAMHAREYITAQVVMRQLCESLDALNGKAEVIAVSPWRNCCGA